MMFGVQDVDQASDPSPDFGVLFVQQAVWSPSLQQPRSGCCLDQISGEDMMSTIQIAADFTRG